MITKTILLFIAFCLSRPGFADELPLQKIQLPQNFKIELLAMVPNARHMALGKGNVLFVGTMSEGKVFALELDENYHAKKLHTLASGLRLPIGVAYREGSLYVAALDRILRYDAIESRLQNPPAPAIVRDNLPDETHHGGKSIGFGPDGLLYVAVGAPCNVCEPGPNH